MEIEVFSLCDFAEDFGGKLCVVGIFETIFVNKLPAVHPHCSIAARIRFDSPEFGKHPFRITLVDEDGKDVIPPLHDIFNVQQNTPAGHATINMAITLGQMLFQRVGKCLLSLEIDRKIVRSMPILVAERRESKIKN